MKEVLISIQPKWCELIANGEKTIEVRNTKPKLETPFKCYIYCTKSELLTKSHYNGKIYVASSKKYQNALERNGNITLSGKVIGEFVCDRINTIKKRGIDNNFDYCYLSLDKWGNDDIELEITAVKNSCVLRDDLNDYGENSRMLYGWHISDFKLYEKPKDISKFYKVGMLSYDDWLYGIYNGNGGARSSYESYKNAFKLSKAPQSWCYVEGAKE